MLALNDTVPNQTLDTDQGNIQLPADQWTILYFYPKDDTPGCTKESIGFSEQLSAFTKLNTRIIGVSKDSLKKHEKFRSKHDLTVFLASDENGSLCEDFGVWVEKSMYGKTYMGIERATFLIDPQGVIQAEWRKVKVPGHIEAVLEKTQELTS